jgi:hypothetical protein
MSIIDTLISSYTPVRDGNFSITLPQGEVLTFKAVNDYSEIRKLATDGAKFWKTLNSERCTPQLKAVKPADEGTAVQAFMLASTSIEPKLTQHDVLRIAKEAGWLFLEIVRQYDAVQAMKTAEVETEELEALGEDSAPTS